MTFKTDEQLQAFLERVMQMSDERGRALSEEEVDQIGLDIGLSEEDLALAKKEGAEHLERARNFLGYGRLDDAIAEFEEALVLLPGRIGPRSELAYALYERFQQTGARADRERAEKLARQCLDVDPNFQRAYELLNQLDRAASGSSGGFSALKVAVVACVGVATLSVLGVLFLGAPKPEDDSVTKATVVSKSSSKTRITPPEEPEPARRERGSYEIPIELVDKADSGLALSARSSTLDVYSEKAFYKFRGFIRAPEGREFDEVEASLQLLDSSSKVLAKLPTRGILQTHHPVLRPDQTHAFYLLKEADAGVERATLTIESAKSYPSDGVYPMPKPIEVKFEDGNSRGFELAFAERELTADRSGLDRDRRHFEASFEVENKGGRPVKLLKVRARFFDAAGEQLDIETLLPSSDPSFRERYVVGSSAPALLRDERRTFAILANVPDSYASYRLTVVEIR